MKLADWVSFLCLLIALIILWRFRRIVLLVFTAVVLATALNSLVRWIVKRFSVARGHAVLISLVLVLVGGILFAMLVAPPFIIQFQELLLLIPKGFERFVDLTYELRENPPSWFPDRDLIQLPDFADLIQQMSALATKAFDNFFAFFQNSLTILLQLLLVIVLTIMMLADPMAYRRLVILLFPANYRRRADDIFSKCEVALICWMKGVSSNSLFVAILSWLGLLLLGVKYVYAHAVMAGVFNFIPNIGPALSAIFPVSVALLDSPGPGKAIAVIVLYLVIQNLESYWFSPMTMQRQVALLPAATLIAQLFFAALLGPLGLILALPLAVVAKTWIEEAWIRDVMDHCKETLQPSAKTFALDSRTAAAYESLTEATHKSLRTETIEETIEETVD
ncbi:MAG: AI-2E family transporter [Pseudanabaenales cyanobacterium]|nr:AI-2E family transporter [Pseudanabaenales cyanobacterium]